MSNVERTGDTFTESSAAEAPSPTFVLSIVVPMYNEEESIGRFFEVLLPVLDRMDLRYEMVCVDDGSTDTTLEKLVAYHVSNPNIKVISLSRNFGKEIALTAGMDHAAGAAVVLIDADLQDPPELIGELMDKWREGYDVVYATRKERLGEGWLKRFTADVFYRLYNSLSPVPMPRNTGDFRLLDRRVVDALSKLPERNRFMKGLFAWVGFRSTCVHYNRQPRHGGTSKWSYWKLWNFAIDGFTQFATGPLRIWSYIGLFFAFMAFLYAGFLILRTLIMGVDVPGYASLMVVTLFLGGVQLVCLGVIGEYLGRIFQEVKGRPLYFVRDAHGLKKIERERG